MRFNEIYKFIDGTLTRILETLDYRVKEFKIKWLSQGMNTRFWTEKDVTRSKEFITAIERRLEIRRIYRNLECFVGGRVRDIDYSFRNSDEYNHDPEKCKHAGPKVTTSHGGNYTTRMIWRFTVVTPRQGGNARRNENGYHHNTMVSIIEKSK
ncbi:hypothetical protein Tco_1466338 [Tanacetum coccineum]